MLLLPKIAAASCLRAGFVDPLELKGSEKWVREGAGEVWVFFSPSKNPNNVVVFSGAQFSVIFYMAWLCDILPLALTDLFRTNLLDRWVSGWMI